MNDNEDQTAKSVATMGKAVASAPSKNPNKIELNCRHSNHDATSGTDAQFENVKMDVSLNADADPKVFVASADSHIHAFRCGTGERVGCLKGHKHRVLCFAISGAQEQQSKRILVSGVINW